MATNHIAAIHALKSKLQLSTDDYRALLLNLTGKSSSTDMSQGERTKVRDHMQGLAERLGVARPARRGAMTGPQFAKSKTEASPRERKVWALWHQLHRDGLVDNPSKAALDAWVTRTVHVSALRFCTPAQLDTCIEALKAWHKRGE
ncbi:regulatory protein GemA [Diaphorobacter caeni]|uniref:regulatory protein GemA n=1 Tax=Diaphorobacter caeni TaxID=2784387 RepID=UPI00188E5814|nr:regulatory protein GemA [Diaphorobacter caeni]MBF5006369.1 regulatory protein GemA [Diaphorobacter caeni]